ncbi:MAG: ribonuclease HI [Parvicella sp.]|jgi:ribonuclease HI
MAKKKQKYYVVWQGRTTGIFHSWDECKRQIDAFTGAQYKSYESISEAEAALKRGYEKSKSTATKSTSSSSSSSVGQPILNSISVDAACSGNPGLMEYKGVVTHNKKELFIKGPYPHGTNNVGEFLALVHGLAFLKKQNSQLPIYSDSRIAIGWVQKKKCKTKLDRLAINEELFDLIERGEKWLRDNTYTTQILKWETKVWGEIPADFGRK